MTKLLDHAVAVAQRLSPDRQDEMARRMLDVARVGEAESDIPPEDLPDILVGLAEADRGEFATDAEIEAALQRMRA